MIHGRRSAPHVPPAPHGVVDGERPRTVTALSWLLLVVAATALPSGVLMMAWPDGSAIGAPLALLDGTPFASFLVPGALLFVCLGVLPLGAALSLRAAATPPWLRPWVRALERRTGRRAAWLAAGASGVAIVVWIGAQVVMIGAYHPLQAIYGGLGSLVVALALAPRSRAWSRVWPRTPRGAAQPPGD